MDLAPVRDRIGQVLAVLDVGAIHKHGHVVPHRALVVEHVATNWGKSVEDRPEHLADGARGYFPFLDR